MKHDGSPNNRLMADDWTGVPLGLTPDGGFIMSAGELPMIPTPAKVVIGQDFFALDGWIFSFSLVTKSELKWLGRQFGHWKKLDPSGDNIRWLNGILDALHDGLTQTQ